MHRTKVSRRSLFGALGLGLAAVLGGMVLRAGGTMADTDKDLFPDPQARTEHRMALVREAVGQFYEQRGRYPETLHELSSSPAAAARELDRLSDGWDRPLSYSRIGAGYQVRSSGADGVPNTADDLVIRISG